MKQKESMPIIVKRFSACRGALAQLGERLVRNEEVGGSIPLCSTIFYCCSCTNQIIQNRTNQSILNAQQQLLKNRKRR